MRADQIVLLSVRPRFAAALLDGTKTVELRRRRARIAPGTLCLLYESSPTCALVGAVRVAETETSDPEDIWSRHAPAMGLTRAEYDNYLEGAAQPCAIVVDATAKFARPIRLHELRRRQRHFVTPQSYRFLKDREAPSLLNGQMQDLEPLSAVPKTAR
ncbi:ASCH domain-containing protein [Conexibacter woesei]|uniref:ASCH domain-containing protein n=1 Tax=Conexibacter woesei TaxID=191495 RepID=UPI000685495B|nr:ASCH domain-containing protein [Conexibacter woesei]